MLIEGAVEEIIFRNDGNGYTVFYFEHSDMHTVCVGKFLQISVGAHLKLEGNFVTNAKYGEQFQVDSFETLYPTSKEGIRKYLGSGLIKGVGPVTAKAIVDVFKEDTLNVIEFAPKELANVRGISERKAEMIGEAFRELKHLQNTVIFLQGYGLTVNMAIKIFEVYQNKTVEIIKENPYKLVEDVEGIGFATADKIARSLGIDRRSEFRIRAGFLYCLTDASEKNGHTYLPKEDLFKNVSKLLEIEEEESFKKVLEDLIFDRTVTNTFIFPHDAVMLTKYFYYERSIADKLALLCCSLTSTELNVDSEIKHFEEVNKITFHPDQKKAIINAVNSGVSIITGGPGTGKTTIVKCIIELLEAQRKKILLTAPTGRAAKKLSEATERDARTIHRALQVDFRSKRFIFNEQNPLPYNVIIVDEVSMVDVPLMCNLLKAVARDTKLIFVGDKDQLPSVGAGNVLEDMLTSGVISVAELTQIYRQSEKSLIISNAHKINEGEMPEIDNKSQDFFFDAKVELEDIKTTIVNMVTTRIPKFNGIDSIKIQVLAPLKAGVCGIENLNRELQAKLNPPKNFRKELTVGQTIFREGDKVMQMSNNYDLEWTRQVGLYTENGAGVFNGDIGYIHSIDVQTGEVEIWFEDGRECIYPRTELSQLSLAYAITIHKSQGSEFDVVIIPIISGPSLILNRNLIYTAVTRAKKMVVLVGEKKNLKRMIGNKFILKRHTALKKLLIDAYKKANILFN
mgnify:FL=1